MAKTHPGGLATIITNVQIATAKGPTMATATTSPVDAGVDTFYAWPDLQIEPDLTGTANLSGTMFKLKQTKDQDVKIIDGQITVVEEIVTAVQPTFGQGEYLYDYKAIKKELQEIATTVKRNGATLKGHVLIRVGDSSQDKYPEWFRLTVVNDTVVAQAARLGFEDGKQTPFPEMP